MNPQGTAAVAVIGGSLEGPAENKILVIEDSAVNRQLVREVLEGAGLTVCEAENAEKGLRLAAQERPQLILIDLYLPGLDGLEAAEMIRSLEGMEQVPIVVMSAATSSEERERVMRADCDYYLRKPIDADELPLLISRLVQGGRGIGEEEGQVLRTRTPAKPILSLEERHKAVEKVRAALNHDLRTPLTVIISYAHTVAQGKVGPLSDKQREMLETVVEQGFEMDAMINELVNIMQQVQGAEKKETPED